MPNGFPTGAAVTFTALITGPAGYSGSITLNTGSAILYHDTGVTVNTYDYLNRLIEVQQYSPNPSGTTSFTRPSDGVVVQANLTETTTYTYDVFGNRIAETNTPAGGTATSTWYVNDGSRIALELTQAGQGAASLTQVRLNGAAVDQVLAVHQVTQAQNAALTDQVFWLLGNRQNTVLDEQTVTNGSPTDLRVGFTTSGKPLSSNPTVPVVIYAGQECDLATQLNFDQARFYDPSMQCFINCDPLGLAAGTNEYCYCDNSWPNATDPTGEWAVIDDVVFTVGGAALGLIGQGMSDLVAGRFSGWEAYVGAGIGGAVAGESTLYLGPIAGGMLGAATANGITQGLRILDGKQTTGFDFGSFALDTGLGGLGGLIGGAVGGRMFNSLAANGVGAIGASFLAGKAAGGISGFVVGGIAGYAQDGWQGVLPGAGRGLLVGAFTGGIGGMAFGSIYGNRAVAPSRSQSLAAEISAATDRPNVAVASAGYDPVSGRVIAETSRLSVPNGGEGPLPVEDLPPKMAARRCRSLLIPMRTCQVIQGEIVANRSWAPSSLRLASIPTV